MAFHISLTRETKYIMHTGKENESRIAQDAVIIGNELFDQKTFVSDFSNALYTALTVKKGRSQQSQALVSLMGTIKSSLKSINDVLSSTWYVKKDKSYEITDDMSKRRDVVKAIHQVGQYITQLMQIMNSMAVTEENQIGGEIALVTSFLVDGAGMNNDRSATYFVKNEKQLPFATTKEKNEENPMAFLNSLTWFETQLTEQEQKNSHILNISNLIKAHFNGWVNMLIQSPSQADQRRAIWIWAWYHLRNRYIEVKKLARKKEGGQWYHFHAGMTLAQFLFGNVDKTVQGYFQESFLHHMAIHHEDIMQGIQSGIIDETMSQKLNHLPIQEFGSISNWDFLELAAAAKGNIASFGGGDIIVANGSLGRSGQLQIVTNIQSKASSNDEYKIVLSFIKISQAFVNFLNQLQRMVDLSNQGSYISPSKENCRAIANDLFQSLKATVWIPIATDKLKKQLKSIVSGILEKSPSNKTETAMRTKYTARVDMDFEDMVTESYLRPGSYKKF